MLIEAKELREGSLLWNTYPVLDVGQPDPWGRIRVVVTMEAGGPRRVLTLNGGDVVSVAATAECAGLLKILGELMGLESAS